MTSSTYVKKIVGLLVAVCLTGFGVAMFISVNLGSDTITVFIDGIHSALGLGYGAASRVYNVLMLLIAFLVARKRIGWITVVFALLVGFAMDFFLDVLGPLEIAEASLMVRFGCIFIAQIAFGFAYALLIILKGGMNQIDAVAYFICDKLNIKYVYVRTALDVVNLVIGFALGGIIGIGSIIAMATTGIFVNTSLKIMKYRDKETA